MITIRINHELAHKVRLIKENEPEYLTISKGFDKWLKYVKREANKLYFDNQNRL